MRRDQQAAAPVVEQLTGGGVRIHGVADHALTRRLGFSQYASTRWLWWCLAPTLVFGPGAMRLVDGPSEGYSLIGDLLISMTLGAAVLAIFAYTLLYIAGADYWRRQSLPPGTPVYADATPDWIGIGWTDTYSALGRAQIERVRKHKSVLAITGCGTSIYVPAELLPSETVSALLAKRTRGHSTDPDAVTVPTATTPAPPFVTVPGALKHDTVIQTHATADATLADRLARSMRHISAVRKAMFWSLPLPIVGVASFLFGSERHLIDSMLLPAVGIGVAGYCIIGYYVFVGAQAHLRKLVSEGTPMSARFGPDSISVQLGGHVWSAGMARLVKVERVDSALVLTAGGAMERQLLFWKPREGLLLPEELVPSHVAEELLARFG